MQDRDREARPASCADARAVADPASDPGAFAMRKNLAAVLVCTVAAVGLGLRIAAGSGSGVDHTRLPWAAVMSFAVAAVIELRS